MKKNFVTKMIAMLCVVTIGLAGCGQKKEDSAKNNQTSEKNFEPKLDTEEKVVLSTSGFFGNFEALDQVIADFNEYYPNVEFTYEQNGIDNFATYIEANPKTDIMMTSEECFEKMGDQLTSICADLKKEDISLKDIDKQMLSRGYHDGQLSCIPMGQNTYGLVVNTSLLKKEGLEIPKNYKEFLSVLTALKKKGYTPIQGPESKVYAELVQGMAYDMILDDKDLYKDLMAGKKSAAKKLQPVYDRMNDMIEKGFIDPSVNETYPDDNYDQAILNFFEGDVPFWVCSTEKVSGMKKRESKSETFQKNPFDYTYIYAPLGEDGVYEYKEPWFGFSVNKNAENYDYAIEFVRFLTRKDEMNTMANIKGIPSAASESQNLDIYKNILNPEKVQLKGVNEGKITSAMISGWYTDVNKYVAGEYATEEEALEDFVNTCSQEGEN